MAFRLRLTILGVLVAASVSPAAEDSEYIKHIKPLLRARCYSCHGVRKQESGLRLDTVAATVRGGDSGAAVLPGDAEGSLLLQRLRADESERMPPEGEPLSADEVERIATWIRNGAAGPVDEAPEPDPRDHWSFQPVQQGRVPIGPWTTPAANTIDAFLLSRLAREQLSPLPAASDLVQIRRLYLDLLGYPPRPQEVTRFRQSDRPDRWTRLLDRTMASPAFGERWGRHWLDLARYADSNGYEDDRQRPHAWRFRDWVIDAFNEDMPFDVFSIRQLAGDLLDDAGFEDQLATGFHRMTLSNEGGSDAVAEEFRIIAVKDRVDTTGSVWMGLSLGCAKCHDHKYDPVSLQEYYELYAFFNNAIDISVPAPPLSPHYTRAYERDLAAWASRLKVARERLARYEKTALQAVLADRERAPGADTRRLTEIREYLKVSALRRSSKDQLALANLIAPIDPDYEVAMGNELLESGNNRPQPPSTKAMAMAAKSRPSHIHRRGRFLDPGDPVQPGTPEFLPPLTARGAIADRLDLARWIANDTNPLTGRVAANRLWLHVFGRGLVETADEFGTTGRPASHPELLDWLAAEYPRRAWSRKSLLRVLLNSNTYRRSSRPHPAAALRDPDNLLLARQRRLRLPAECVRDSALAVAGTLNDQIGGPPFQPPLPAGLQAAGELRNERLMPQSHGADRYRRGVYINVQRMMMLPMLESFDVADPNATCARRERSVTPIQALTLLNDPVFFDAAQALGQRIVRECPADVYERIRFSFRLCLVRDPSDAELLVLERLFRRQLAVFRANPEQANDVAGIAPASGTVAELAAWVGVARTLLNVDEFITRE